MHVIVTEAIAADGQVSEEVQPFVVDTELSVGGEALYVRGIGWIAQYHCWLDRPGCGIELFVHDLYRLHHTKF
tara:strand:- start:3532 stop:3750 length:219 start_codon:yes stop_codon:yes gene_type:complete